MGETCNKVYCPYSKPRSIWGYPRLIASSQPVCIGCNRQGEEDSILDDLSDEEEGVNKWAGRCCLFLG